MIAGNGTASVPGLIAELADARAELLRNADAVFDARKTDAPLVGDWGLRELMAHLGYWSGFATEAIHAAEMGRPPDELRGQQDVDARNATVARVARATDLRTVQARESAAFDALLERVGRMDPALLDVPQPDGGTLADEIRENSVDHYREHAAQLRSLARD